MLNNKDSRVETQEIVADKGFQRLMAGDFLFPIKTAPDGSKYWDAPCGSGTRRMVLPPDTMNEAEFKARLAAFFAQRAKSRDPYVPPGEPFERKGQEIIITMRASDIKPVRISWRWKGWLAEGKVHLIAGAPEAGKTTIALSFAAADSSGGTWPDGTKARQGNVLIWTSEDDPADTLVPRLMRMGADLDRIYFISKTRQENGRPRPFNPAIDMPGLIEKAKAIGDVSMLIVDPVVAVIPGNRDSHKAAETRNALQPLLDFTEAVHCVTIGIAHLTKGTAGKDPLERVNGSGSFGQVPRIVLFAAKNDAEGDGQPERIMVRVKSNIGRSGGGFGYHIDAAPLIECPDIEATRIVWEYALEGAARELLADAEPEADDARKERPRKKAEQFLRSALAKGERPQTEIEAEADLAGMKWATIRRAGDDIPVRKRQANKRWFWSL
jgi:putative DNA primase/helicase